ncbi:hypothetical protein AWC38_SpisGene22793 [Stylophora pistillata]|uniref:TIR domain-containing protein n=1 Tax=Stylophora pistillata TaxID=50429 RepID=A0A2B4R682_STYPI|nr:hypothetical protein AWC38_SpisGene22793 [Stylophora pistillata]
MQYILFLYAESDKDEAEALKDYLQGKLRSFAELRNVGDAIAGEQEFTWELRRSHCVVLIVSRLSSSLIQNKRQEVEDEFVTFDGKVVHDEFKENKELLERLIIVSFTERNRNDWIPDGFDERKIFCLKAGV